jgi:hypothetical protein
MPVGDILGILAAVLLVFCFARLVDPRWSRGKSDRK